MTKEENFKTRILSFLLNKYAISLPTSEQCKYLRDMKPRYFPYWLFLSYYTCRKSINENMLFYFLNHEFNFLTKCMEFEFCNLIFWILDCFDTVKKPESNYRNITSINNCVEKFHASWSLEWQFHSSFLYFKCLK